MGDEDSKFPREKQLDAITSTGAELPPSHKHQSLVDKDFAQSATHFGSRKRQLDTASASASLPAKRARLTRTDAQSDSGPLRRSARLQARQHPASSEDPAQLVSPAPSGKPQVDSNATFVPPPPKRARLTRENLRQFNRMTKSKSAGGKGAGPISSSRTKTTTEVNKSAAKTVSTTTTGFKAQAIMNGILDPMDSKAPANLDVQRARLNQARDTPSPTESDFKDYVAGVTTAPNEQTMMPIMHDLLKKYKNSDEDRGYRKIYNQPFTNFPKEVGFNNGLSTPQPDFVEGLQAKQFLPFVATELDGAVLIKDDIYSITLPHIAGEFKGPGGDMNKARTQSAYAGAALVYGRDQALGFLGDPDPPGHAAVSSFTTDGTHINFFSHYSALSEKQETQYHQYLITSTNSTGSYEKFKKGRKQLRNLQQEARAQSYKLRDRFVDHWEEQNARPSVQRTAIRVSFDGVQEESWPIATQEGIPDPGDANGYAQPARSTKPTRHKHTSRKAPHSVNSHSTDDEDNYEIVGELTHVPTSPPYFKTRRQSTQA